MGCLGVRQLSHAALGYGDASWKVRAYWRRQLAADDEVASPPCLLSTPTCLLSSISLFSYFTLCFCDVCAPVVPASDVCCPLLGRELHWVRKPALLQNQSFCG